VPPLDRPFPPALFYELSWQRFEHLPAPPLLAAAQGEAYRQHLEGQPVRVTAARTTEFPLGAVAPRLSSEA
jgi:hypothetical protein